ncbi:Sodium- and chloride-dependent betaine transporter [Liparis tanakae]|uniref:Sodium-and chloride-dependent betaine transporter n=1 Tax=Liparis tanakae TaxID=230148 RepID=A0A4Z2F3J1_9TELE|nr:Sodium- and chloride-dependent betaine transporter [Liparis tanakae]
MLAILLVRGLTLPGAWQGVVYYLYPDPSRLADFQVWMEACAQVLFSYGVAAGTLITLGSYNKVNNNCYKDSLWLCVLNSATSFISGFAVFSVLGFMAQKQGIPIDKVVDSGLETITSSLIDMFPGQMRRPWRREIFLFFFCFICFIIQISLTTQGGVYVFQLIDYYGVNGICLVFVSAVQCVAVGWAFGADRMCDAVQLMTGQRPWGYFTLCWRYFTPLLCMVCFFGFFLDHQPLTTSGGYMYPDWAYVLGWAMALSSLIAVPIWAVVKICLTKGSLTQRLSVLCRPVVDSVDPVDPESIKERGTEMKTMPALSPDVL